MFNYFLAELNSYELVKMPSNDERPLLSQVPRFKQPATDGMSCLMFFFRVCVCVYIYMYETSNVSFFFSSLFIRMMYKIESNF